MDLACLPRAADLALQTARNPRWQPKASRALHSEIFADGDDGGGIGMLLALAGEALAQNQENIQEERAILWVQDERTRRHNGYPYRPGLPEALRHRVIYVAANSPEDALFALEEGARCRDLSCVIGELSGNPKALTFTASRRLSLAAEKHKIPLFILRHDARPDLSSARMRWRASSSPSPSPLWNNAAPGQPSWRGELFRSRFHPPGEWILRDDGHVLNAQRHPIAQTIPATAPDHGDLVRATGA